jgi:putative membrane protein
MGLWEWRAAGPAFMNPHRAGTPRGPGTARFDRRAPAGLRVRLVSLGFVLVGILAMAAATRPYLRTLKLIRRDDFLCVDQRSISIFTAIALTIIGVFVFALLVMGSPLG